MQLEEERQKHSKIDSVFTEGERMENGTDLHFIEMQSMTSDATHKHTEVCINSFTHTFHALTHCLLPVGDANRQISEYKFKLSKAEQEMATMEQNVSL